MDRPGPPENAAGQTKFDSVPGLGPGTTGAVVWHRDHLRVSDHPAVAAAAEYDEMLPLFVFDPAFYGPDGLACDSRIGFLHDCLADLNDQYHTAIGTGLTYVHGEPVEVLERFCEAGWEIRAAATVVRFRRTGPGVAFSDVERLGKPVFSIGVSLSNILHCL